MNALATQTEADLAPWRAKSPPSRWLAVVLPAVAVVAVVLHYSLLRTVADPDMWHEMSLAREIVRLGHVPDEDVFAYTPTVRPLVHHEWGAGMVLYGAWRALGNPGILVVKYALMAAFGGGAVWVARRRGASVAVLCVLAVVAMPAVAVGITTVRAGMFTMAMLVALLAMLEADRRGGRKWVWLWLPLYVVWLNLHGGFLVGAAVLVLHTLEQALRRRPVRHLLLTLVAMAALIVINPWGLHYYAYLLRANLADRELITEWWPLWQIEPPFVAVYLAMIAVLALAVWRRGWANVAGIGICAVLAAIALRHYRHFVLFGLTWFVMAPAWLTPTPLGQWLQALWQRRQKWMGAVAAVAILATLPGLSRVRPWTLPFPDDPDGPTEVAYPVRAVDYLADSGFHGNLMTPFVYGAYVTWRLYPAVKVSMDGRYEVAYPMSLLPEQLDFYKAKPGWRKTLEKYPTDAVLVSHKAAVEPELAKTDWRLRYSDEAWAIYVRPGG